MIRKLKKILDEKLVEDLIFFRLVQVFAKGYNEENSKVIENDLNGLSGVMFVHIHAHDGETVVDYMPSKTKLTEILKVYENHDVDPNL